MCASYGENGSVRRDSWRPGGVEELDSPEGPGDDNYDNDPFSGSGAAAV